MKKDKAQHTLISEKHSNIASQRVVDSQIKGFSERLRQCTEDSSVREFARNADISEATIRSYLNRSSFPSLDRLAILAKAAGVSLEWLATGYEHVEISDSSSSGDVPSTVSNDVVWIPRYEVAASEGFGNHIFSENEVEKIPIHPDMLNSISIKNTVGLIFIKSDGNSMEPTISDDSLLLVDPSVNRLKNDSIYVINYDGEIFLKRIQRDLKGGILVKSDNPLYEVIHITKDEAQTVRIIGKVLCSISINKL